MKNIFLILVLTFSTFLVSNAQEISELGNTAPFTLNGSVSANCQYSNRQYGNTTPFGWLISSSINPAIYGFEIPLSFSFGSAESNFSQPFNQIGISPSYKWLKTHLGYRSLTFSKYSLSGVPFLGAGLELTPGNFNFGIMKGRFQRATQTDSTSPIAAAFERSGYALKLGFGSDNTFFNISFFHAQDDTNSLRATQNFSNTLPLENSVVTLGNKISLLDNIISFESEAGLCVVSRDIRAENLDLTTSKIPQFLANIHTPKTSTSLGIAGNAGLNFNLNNFGLRILFERIDPNYCSLGTYFANNDFQNITLVPRANLFGGMLNINASLGLQTDNTLNTKENTSSRVIGSAYLNIKPNQDYSLDIGFTNYNALSEAVSKKAYDSSHNKNTSLSISISPRYTLVTENQMHNFGLMGSVNRFNNEASDAIQNISSSSSTTSVLASYNLSYKDSPTNFGAGLSFSNSDGTGNGSTTLGGNVNMTKSFMGNKLNLNAGVSMSISEASGNSFSSLGLNSSANFKPTEDDGINMALSLTKNFSEGSTNNLDMSLNVGYNRAFNIVK